MSHPAEETLLAHADGELAALEQAQVAHHLARCTACRARVEGLKSVTASLGALVHALDTAEPVAWQVDEPASSSKAADLRPVRVLAPSPPVRRRDALAVRWAAAISLAAGAAAAAALLGVPLLQPDPAAGPLVPYTAAPSPAAGGAIAVQPDQGALDIVLENVAPDTHIAFAFHAGDDVVVEIRESDTAWFRAARGQLTADLRGRTATIQVRAPSALRAGVLRVNGQLTARFAGGELTRVRALAGVTVSTLEGR